MGCYMLAFATAWWPRGSALPLADWIGGYTDAELALMISGVALLYAVIRWRRNTLTRKPSISSTGSEKLVMNSALNVREITMEIEALVAELEETSRRLTAQLDNRCTRLEQLLGEADEKIRELQALTGGEAAPDGKKTGDAPLHKPAAAAPAPVAEAQRALARLRKERGAPAAADDPAYVPIYTLADGGKNPREIAQELGRQPGEIELILALRHHAV